MAIIPIKTADKPEATSETDKAKPTSETDNTEQPKDFGGAHPKTRQQKKAMVRGHISVLTLFSPSISKTNNATGVYIILFVL